MNKNIEQICKNIRSSIAQDNIKQALEELNNLTTFLQIQTVADEIIILAGKHKRLVKGIINGILTYEQQEISLNRIRVIILDLVSTIETNDTTEAALLSTLQNSYQRISDAGINQQHTGNGDNVVGDKINNNNYYYSSTQEEENTSISNVPRSITFGKKILCIPSLEEMGIPFSGLGRVTIEPKLFDYRYGGGYWIDRGDKLLTYNFYAFTKERDSFLEKLAIFFDIVKSPVTSDSWTIVSPVSGLMISARHEQTTENNPSTGLVYHWNDRPLLPIILIPDNEPYPPSTTNLYSYNSLSSWLLYYFKHLPIRDRSDFTPQRLKDHMMKHEWATKQYSKDQEILKNRDRKAYTSYNIREISSDDGQLISKIQNLRSKYLDLREKLVHISREFGDSV